MKLVSFKNSKYVKNKDSVVNQKFWLNHAVNKNEKKLIKFYPAILDSIEKNVGQIYLLNINKSNNANNILFEAIL